jgi:NADPH:quinone reductase-like Zn-dependent oxidoreductase
MRAAVCERYGPPEVVQIREVPKPVPASNEVLIKARATTVNSGDTRMRALRVPRGLKLPMRLKLGITKPKQPIFGFDVAGRIEEVGDAVTDFRPGDEVVASRGFDFGCHAEYVAVPQGGAIASLPEGLSAEHAVALCFGGSTTLDFFRLGEVTAGEKILINGASGAVGTMAVQLGKERGLEVTAVTSGRNAALMQELGADHVIDYQLEDFTSNGQRYDLIMDTFGNASFSKVKGSLTESGRHLTVAGGLGAMLNGARNKAVVLRDEKNSPSTPANFLELMALAGRGVLKPVIEAILPFGEIAEAHRRVDGGHKVGSIVLTWDGT